MKKKRYGFFGNLKFIVQEQASVDKKGLALPFFRILSKLIVSLITLFLPKIVLDAVENNSSVKDMVIRIVIATVGLVLFGYIDIVTNNAMNNNSNRLLLVHYTGKQVEKELDMDFEIYSSPTGKMMAQKAQNSLGNNISNGIGSFYPSLVNLLTNLFGFASYIVILVSLNHWIIAFLLLSYAFDGVFELLIESWIHKSKNERADIDRKINYIAFKTRAMSIGKDIRLYSMSDWLNELADIYKMQKIGWEKKVAHKRLMNLLFHSILLFLRDGIAYIYLAYLMFTTDMSIGTFSLYFGAISGFGNWLINIVNNISTLVGANNSVVDFREFMDLPDNMKRVDGKAALPADTPITIKLENVCYRYEGQESDVLHDIDFTIKAGERLAIVGLNGAGKTTLVKLISGLIQPTQGRITVNDIDISEFNRDEYYKMFTAVFQDINVIPNSVAKNIAMKDDVDFDKAENCLKLAGLSEKVSSLPNGINTNLVKYISDNGVDLSGGEMQKLILARALYKDASVIILDEPTAALDPVAENEMYMKFDELFKEKTSIFISHRLSSTQFCDRIILLDGNKIAEYGSHEELMKLDEKYARLFNTQSKYYQEGGEAEYEQ